ncbi:flagellar hook-associated protein FlgK [Sulfitobacter sp. LCG007]
MSISTALSNAMSGLRAAGRASQVVSSNISNATTPGYGVREISLSSSQIGGVTVEGIVRIVDPVLVADLRLASAGHEKATTIADFHEKLEGLVGTADNEFSLAARIAGFEEDITTAASRPDATERLENVVHSARDLASTLERASLGVQEMRTNADTNIELQVNRLNAALKEVEDLNTRIKRTGSVGGDTSALEDNRQALVDEISGIVPVRQVPRDHGEIALYSTGGAILLDNHAAEIGFTRSNQVTPYMTIGAGTLSGLTLNDLDIRTDSVKGHLRGGSLGALFEIRDELGVEAQAKLDAVARDLIERFEDPAVDPTLAVGDPGLFTDDGLAFDPLAEVGISQRIRINALVDPQNGGDAWRIRDGIGAAVPGDVGDARLIQALGEAMLAKRVPASGGFGSGAFDAINLTSTLSSQLGAERYQADQRLTFAAAEYTEMTELVLAQGVDSDSELQKMMVIEQIYAANARVIEAITEMMDSLLRL